MILLPRPQSVQNMEGSFAFTPETRIVLAPAARKMLVAARQLQQDILQFAGLRLEILCGDAREGDVLLTFAPETAAAEGYHLVIRPESVCITGQDAAGLMWGVQTLRQIIRLKGAVLPSAAVEDAPVFPHRGFYHDATRGRTPTLDWLKTLADEACFYKLNQLQLYVEHTYLFRDLTELWSAGEPLTAQEIMELDDYCHERQIELVPSLASFGHLFELLNTKSHCHLCELESAGQLESTMPNRMTHHTINISDPDALPLVEGMLKEFMPLFRSRRFNICADETFDLGKGRGREAMEKAGAGAYYMDFVNKLCGIVSGCGLQPMFWGDIVIQHPESLEYLPKDTICLNWGYSPEVTEDGTRILAGAGAVQYVCPGVIGWNCWMNKLHDSYRNILRMSSFGRKYGAVGLLNTDWGDFGHINDPRFSLPGMIMGAHFSWSAEELSYERICEDISRLSYLDSTGKVVKLLGDLADCDLCGWWNLVQHREFVIGRDDAGYGDTLQKRDLNQVEERCRRAAEIARELTECAVHMDSCLRGMLQGWLIACEAIQVWNLAGVAEQSGETDAALAVRLERWLRQYELLWRQVSKESELWRIREMTRWYAARLRCR